MSQTRLPALDRTVQTTHLWIDDVAERLGWQDKHRPYLALRAVLHALRDRLSVDGAAALGAQLPLLVRGCYYEGWHPAGKPLKERKLEEFLAHVAAAGPAEAVIDPEAVTKAVFGVIAKHVDTGEVEKVKSLFPAELRSLWL